MLRKNNNDKNEQPTKKRQAATNRGQKGRPRRPAFVKEALQIISNTEKPKGCTAKDIYDTARGFFETDFQSKNSKGLLLELRKGLTYGIENDLISFGGGKFKLKLKGMEKLCTECGVKYKLKYRDILEATEKTHARIRKSRQEKSEQGNLDDAQCTEEQQFVLAESFNPTISDDNQGEEPPLTLPLESTLTVSDDVQVAQWLDGMNSSDFQTLDDPTFILDTF